jgi:hypothetical protein
MVKDLERVIIEIKPDSEVARVLRAAGERPVVLVSGGARYEVVRIERDGTHENDAEAFRAVLREAAGTFTPEEAEQLKQNIYRWREEGTRPIDRPRMIDRLTNTER